MEKEDVAEKAKKECERLYKRYERLIFSIAYEITGNPEDAEDVTIDVFAAFFNQGDRMLEVKNPKSYLSAAARNRAYRFVSNVTVPFDEENGSELSVYDSYSLSGNRLIQVLKAGLSHEEFVVFISRVIEEKSFAEIAQENHASVAMATSAYRRGKRKARELLKENKL